MIRKLFSLAALMLVVASCANVLDNVESLRMRAGDTPVFYATIEGNSDAETKVFADSKMRVLWNADDRISIFNKTTYNWELQFTGEDGDNAGGFAPMTSPQSGAALDHIYSVYPYSKTTAVSQDGTISLTLPDTQTYKENSFGIGANTMVSVTDNNQLRFKNVGGYLSFKFYGDGVSVKSIKLQGNNNEKLSGAANVTMAVNGAPATEMQANATKTITLTCTEPVAIGADKNNATEFWFVLPPTDFTQGITVTVTDAQGGVFVMNSAAHLTFERNVLTRLSAKKVVPVPQAEHEAVDLGLSVKWATCNVGADSPEGYGDYFAWGETEPKEYYGWSTYKWCNDGDYGILTKYNNDSAYGSVDNRTCLELSDDAAYVNWGSKWRMPTDAEWTELRTNCDWTWTTRNGINGTLIKSKTNGNSIFLPAAGLKDNDNFSYADSYGFYWSSSLYTDVANACGVTFSSGVIWSRSARNHGFTVRPVYGDKISVSEVRLNKTDLTLKEGGIEQLTATVLPENAAEKGVTWSSSKPSVASVSATGRIFANQTGEAVITVTTIDGEIMAQCAITVTAAPSAEPEAVDLGLSVKWATFNVGAASPEEYGKYFAWGETEPKLYYEWSNYKWCKGSSTTVTKYNGTVDNRIILEMTDDAARVNWGSKWRMPTDAEWTELITGCDWTWTTLNGVNGHLVKSKTNGKSIFLPAAGSRSYDALYGDGDWGCYWSSSPNSDYPDLAWREEFLSDFLNNWSSQYRFHGLSVRPVFGDLVAVSEVHLNKTDFTLTEGVSEQLTATVLPENAADKRVQWSSSKPSIASVDENGLVVALKTGTTVITVTTVDGGKTAECAVTVTAPVPEAVDLGLSVKWASFNVGAYSPEVYGDYFAWGETAPKENYDWSTYTFCNGSEKDLTKYNNNSKYGDVVDNKTCLEMCDDAAHVNWGDKWRMPTDAELTELRTGCDWAWTTQNGVNGYLVKSKTNGNSIFLPAAGSRFYGNLGDVGSSGRYWSSSINTNYPYYAYGLHFSSEPPYKGYSDRFNGYTIRPVYGDVRVSEVRLNKTDISLKEGGSEQLTAMVLPDNAADKDVKWSSSMLSVATVDANGFVTAKQAGIAVVTVTTVDGSKTAQCTVTVTAATPAEPDAIDLGLSVKWASFNVGAGSPVEYGDCFAWGETELKESYSWSTYKWCNGGHSTLTKYNYNNEYGTVDNRIILEMSDDAARVNWGSKWRVPTDVEWTELRTGCDWTWTSQNGVNGYLIQSKTNGNSIFLPAAGMRSNDGIYSVNSYGYYWSSFLHLDGPNYAWGVYFGASNFESYGNGRYYGLSVRPVFGDLVTVSSVQLSKTDISLLEGESWQLTATVLPEDAVYKGVKWSSSKPSVASVDENGLVVALEAGTTVITVTTVDGGKTAECAVTVTAPVPEAVDLGLSVKWATFNVGAYSPEVYGRYFAWGETAPKETYNWSTYKWCNGRANTLTKYNNNSEYGTVDNRTTLLMEDDAARANWGGSWRMPTEAELTELKDNCDWTWTTLNGVNGYLVKSRTNSNSIFLPAAGLLANGTIEDTGVCGYYWSSSLYLDNPIKAYMLGYYSGQTIMTGVDRFYGFTVRPVIE